MQQNPIMNENAITHCIGKVNDRLIKGTNKGVRIANFIGFSYKGIKIKKKMLLDDKNRVKL